MGFEPIKKADTLYQSGSFNMLVLSGVGIRGTGNEYGTPPVVSDNSAPASKKEAGAHLIPEEQKKTPNSKPNSENAFFAVSTTCLVLSFTRAFPVKTKSPVKQVFPGPS